MNDTKSYRNHLNFDKTWFCFYVKTDFSLKKILNNNNI